MVLCTVCYMILFHCVLCIPIVLQWFCYGSNGGGVDVESWVCGTRTHLQ